MINCCFILDLQPCKPESSIQQMLLSSTERKVIKAGSVACFDIVLVLAATEGQVGRRGGGQGRWE